MKKNKWIINKFYLSNNIYKLFNIYDMWVVRRILMQGFAVYYCYNSTINKKYTKIYTTATIYDLQAIFKTYKCTNHNKIRVYFFNSYFVSVCCLNLYNISIKFFYSYIIKYLFKTKDGICCRLYDFIENEFIDIECCFQGKKFNFIKTLTYRNKNLDYNIILMIFNILLSLKYNVNKEVKFYIHHLNCFYFYLDFTNETNIIKKSKSMFILTIKYFKYFPAFFIKYICNFISLSFHSFFFLLIIFPIFIKLFYIFKFSHFCIILSKKWIKITSKKLYIQTKIYLLISNLIIFSLLYYNKDVSIKLKIVQNKYFYKKKYLYQLYQNYQMMLF